MTACELQKDLEIGRITSYEVMKYYIDAAKRSQGELNCLTWTLWNEALERAKELDHIFQETGKLVGPLHGLPISIKDCIEITGTPSTLGSAKKVKLKIEKMVLCLMDLKIRRI